MKRRIVNPMSKKYRDKLAERTVVRESVMYRAKGDCEARIPTICTTVATDVHEVWTRARGGDILDEGNCLALCRRCHQYVTANPSWSADNGFTIHAWEGHDGLVQANARRSEWDAVGRPLVQKVSAWLAQAEQTKENENR